MAQCRSCLAEIVWGRNDKPGGGKGVPLDPDPVADGNVVEVGRTERGEILVKYLKQGDEPPGILKRYNTHFVTCPNADQHRKS